MSEVSFKLKGNESFNIREGWLNKGIEAIREDPTVFTQSTAMDTLGVGSKTRFRIQYHVNHAFKRNFRIFADILASFLQCEFVN